MIWSSRFFKISSGQLRTDYRKKKRQTNLEPFVLQYFLDCDVIAVLAWGSKSCLKDDTKRAISDNFAIRVWKFPCFGRLAVGGNNFDYLVGVIYCWWDKKHVERVSIEDDSERKAKTLATSLGGQVEYVDTMRLEKGERVSTGKREGLDGVKRLTRDLYAVYWAVNGHGWKILGVQRERYETGNKKKVGRVYRTRAVGGR